jgi:hypothetical protein
VKKQPTTPLRRAPSPKNQEDALDAFAAAAGHPVEENDGGGRSSGGDKEYPWELPGVRADVMKSFPLRMAEPMYLKLKFIAENTPYSMNSFVLEKIAAVIEEEIAGLTGR